MFLGFAFNSVISFSNPAGDGFQNSLLNDMCQVEYPFPDESQTGGFIHCVLSRKDGDGQSHHSALEEGFTEQDFAILEHHLDLTPGWRTRSFIGTRISNAA